jgi:hypothetical protein
MNPKVKDSAAEERYPMRSFSGNMGMIRGKEVPTNPTAMPVINPARKGRIIMTSETGMW